MNTGFFLKFLVLNNSRWEEKGKGLFLKDQIGSRLVSWRSLFSIAVFLLNMLQFIQECNWTNMRLSQESNNVRISCLIEYTIKTVKNSYAIALRWLNGDISIFLYSNILKTIFFMFNYRVKIIFYYYNCKFLSHIFSYFDR